MDYLTKKEKTEISNQDTFIKGKIRALVADINQTHEKIIEAKNAAADAERIYASTGKIHFIKRHKQKQEMERAFRNLQLVQADSTASTLRIVRDVVGIVLLCFALPMDLIQKLGGWVVHGFKKRDEELADLSDDVTNLISRK